MAATPQTAVEDRPAQAPRRNWVEAQAERVRSHGLFSALLVVVAVVGGLGTFTSALDGTFSRVQERCRDVGLCDPLPPAELVGTLTEVRLGAANVPQREAWAERNIDPPRDLTPEDAAWPGRFVTYRVEFRGMVDAVCPVRWTLLHADSEERVVDRTYGWKTVHAVSYPDSRWTVEATREDVNIGLLWVPYVAAGRFLVEVELYDADGVLLDVERTGPFTVPASDLVSGATHGSGFEVAGSG